MLTYLSFPIPALSPVYLSAVDISIKPAPLCWITRWRWHISVPLQIVRLVPRRRWRWHRSGFHPVVAVVAADYRTARKIWDEPGWLCSRMCIEPVNMNYTFMLCITHWKSHGRNGYWWDHEAWRNFYLIHPVSNCAKNGALHTGTKTDLRDPDQCAWSRVRLDKTRSKQSCQIRIKAPTCPCRGKVVYTEICIGSGSWAPCGAPHCYFKKCLTRSFDFPSQWWCPVVAPNVLRVLRGKQICAVAAPWDI